MLSIDLHFVGACVAAALIIAAVLFLAWEVWQLCRNRH